MSLQPVPPNSLWSDMKLVLNLSQVRYYNRRRVRAAFRIVAVTGGVLALLLLFSVVKSSEDASRLEQELSRLKAEVSQVTGEGKKVPATEARRIELAIEEINDVLISHGFRWSRFLQDLEEVVPQNARIRSVSPGVAGKPTSVQGVATDPAVLQELLRRIGASPNFGPSYLLQQSEGVLKDTRGREHQVVNFTLSLGRSEGGQ